MDIEGVGAYIRRRRGELGLTQKALADRAGTSSAYISQIEGGKVGLPGVEIRRGLATALGESQIEQLIAAGEIRRDEMSAGPQSSTLDSRLPPAIRDLLTAIDWSRPDAVSFAASSLTMLKGYQRGTPKLHDPNEVERKRSEEGER